MAAANLWPCVKYLDLQNAKILDPYSLFRDLGPSFRAPLEVQVIVSERLGGALGVDIGDP